MQRRPQHRQADRFVAERLDRHDIEKVLQDTRIRRAIDGRCEDDGVRIGYRAHRRADARVIFLDRATVGRFTRDVRQVDHRHAGAGRAGPHRLGERLRHRLRPPGRRR